MSESPIDTLEQLDAAWRSFCELQQADQIEYLKRELVRTEQHAEYLRNLIYDLEHSDS